MTSSSGTLTAFIGIFVASGLARRPAVVTNPGAEQRDYLLGVRDYLQLVEADRFTMLQSPEGADRVDIGSTAALVKLYEKMLPFAGLWGGRHGMVKETRRVLRRCDIGGLARAVATASTLSPTWTSGGESGGGGDGGR